MLCPYCAEEIKNDAIKCKHCGEWLKKESSNLKEIAGSALGSIIGVHDKLLGSNKTINPTDAAPLIVDENLVFYGSFFSYYETRLRYEDVRFLNLFSNWDYTNINHLLSIGSGTITLAFSCQGWDDSIFLYADSTVAVFKFKGKRRKLVENAYRVLASRSYQARFDWYMTQFREKDYVLYCPSYHTEKLLIKMSETAKEDWAKYLKSADPIQAVLMATFAGEKAPAPDTYVRVKIYQNGILQVHHKGTYKQVDLKKAYREGVLGLQGTEAYSPLHTLHKTDPYELFISEKKGMFAERVMFSARVDNDVICEIIAQIAKS